MYTIGHTMYKDVIYNNNNIYKVGRMELYMGRVFKQIVRMLNVTPIVFTKKLSIEYIRKEMRVESRWFTSKNQLNTKGGSNEGMGDKESIRKQIAKQQK